MSTEQLHELGSRLNTWDARIRRLKGDKKAGTARIDQDIAEAETAKAQLLAAAKGLMDELGRHKVTTLWGDLTIEESVSTEVTDIAVKWAASHLPSAVKTSVTLGSLTAAGAKWVDSGLEGEKILQAPDGNEIEGVIRTVTKVAKIQIAKSARLNEEPEFGEWPADE